MIWCTLNSKVTTAVCGDDGSGGDGGSVCVCLRVYVSVKIESYCVCLAGLVLIM